MSEHDQQRIRDAAESSASAEDSAFVRHGVLCNCPEGYLDNRNPDAVRPVFTAFNAV